jgi:PAS domain S-box-containing protein
VADTGVGIPAAELPHIFERFHRIRDVRSRTHEGTGIGEERFRRYFELGLIGMAITSPTKGLIEVNDEICNILGYERSELLRMTWADLTHPDDLDADVAQFNRIVAGEIDGYAIDKRWIRKDGQVIDATISVKCLRRADGSVDYFVALLQDITEQKRAEEALQRAHEELEQRVIERTERLSAANATLIKEIVKRKRTEEELLALKDQLASELTAMTRLHEFSTQLLASTELQPLLDEILEATIAMLNADFGNVQLYNPQTQTLEIVTQRGFQQEFLDYFNRVHEGTASCGTALLRRERVFVEEVETDPSFASHLHIVAGAGYRAVQSTPLFSRSGEPLGMISTHFRQRHRPSECELRLTDLYARLAAEMIERKQSEEALRGKQQELQDFIENASIGMHWIGLDGTILWANQWELDLLGYEREEYVSHNIREFHADSQVVEEMLARLARGETLNNFEARICCRDGSIRYVVVNSNVFWKDGEFVNTRCFTRDITEHKRAEAELSRSEAYLAEGQRISRTGSWAVKFPSEEVFWSQEVFRIYGLDPATTRLSLEMAFGLIHPEDRPVVKETFERALREKTDYNVEHRAILADGTVKHLHVLGHSVLSKSGRITEYVGTVVDITERKQGEVLLRNAHERLEMILDSITDMFFAVDKEWRYTRFNKQAEEQLKVLGKDPASLLGKVLWDEFPNPPPEQALRRAMSERVSITYEHFYEPLGEWVENRIYPGPDGGLGMFVRYVTERKRAEEALQKLQTELAHVTRVATMGELTASIAHEINQPLGAIVTNGQSCLRLLARESPDINKSREVVERMISDGLRASDVVTRIRALLRRKDAEKALLNLNEVIQEVIALTSTELSKDEIHLQTAFAADLPAVLGDRVQLQQVILNLILNGKDAMSGVEWQPRELLITTLGSMPGEVLVAVRDSGTGIDPQDCERIFDQFFTTKSEGLGLGLSISRTIIESHGGRLWATPNEDKGATIQFTLPAG